MLLFETEAKSFAGIFMEDESNRYIESFCSVATLPPVCELNVGGPEAISADECIDIDSLCSDNRGIPSFDADIAAAFMLVIETVFLGDGDGL